MAVETTATSANFVGTGVSSTYAPGFYVNSSDQVVVTVDGVIQTLGDDYVVNNVGASAGCDIVATFTLGAAIYIERATPVTQLVDTQNNETILEDVLDAAFDKLTMIAQEIDGSVGRALLFPKGESGPTLPAPTSRASKFLGFDALGAFALLAGGTPAVADAQSLLYAPAFSNATQRTAAAKFGDLRSVLDFTTPALADASADRIFVPNGTTATTAATGAALNNAYWGQGQLRTADNNKRGKFFSAIKAAPASLGNHNSIDTAWNGDWSHSHFVIEHRVSGAATLGQPATGYVYTPEAYPFYGMMFVDSSTGWNQGTATNVGRTAVCFARVDVKHYGNGDAVCWNATAFVAGNKAGATHFLAQPAGVLFNGDMSCGSNYVYMNPRELHLSDNGYDVAAIGDVVNMNRTNGTGGQSCWWAGYRAQSVGTIAVNCIFSATGKFNSGFDLAMSFLDFGANKAAISLKQNDRIYLNNASANDLYTTTFNGDYITYSSGISGILLVVGGSGVFQVTNSQITSTVTMVASGLRVNAATATAGAGQLAFGTTTAATATLGASGALPAQVLGYLVANLAGTTIKIPYYNA